MSRQFPHRHSDETNVVSLDSYRPTRSAPDDDVPPLSPGPLSAWPVTVPASVEAVASRPRATAH
jgi:hypothetical protein